MQSKDVDRADLHQIHSYAGYYLNDLVVSGLIYPLSKKIDLDKFHSNSLYGNDNNNVRFIVDGIYVDENQTMDDLIESENRFVKRMTQLTSNH